jgi:hypothetical protein
MKKLLLLLGAGYYLCSPAAAQPANGGGNDKINGVLEQLPAKDPQSLQTSMEAIAALGEKGQAAMMQMLSPEGKGDDTRLQYAIGGYAFYVTQPGKEKERRLFAEACCESLQKLSDKEDQQFLISQLQIAGKEDAVPCLKRYLADEKLRDPATRALAQIQGVAGEATPSTVKPFTLSKKEKREGFKILFDGTSLDQWTGNKTDYIIENGDIVIYPNRGGKGNLYTKDEFGNFIFRFEFQLTPNANNGLGVRAPLDGDAAYSGMELQILDNEAEMYKALKPYQYHGSVYGVLPAKRGFLKPTGEWNQQEVVMKGTKVKVILNGTVILDGDLAEARKNGTHDGHQHPGLQRDKGHFGFLGHGSVVRFRNIRVKEL